MAVAKRLPAVAGTFYPESPVQLRSHVERYLAAAKNFHIRPKCIIAPHAGYVYSGPVAGVAYAQLGSLPPRHRRIILLGPSHHQRFTGAGFADYAVWQTPLGEIRTLPPPASPIFSDQTAAHNPEHCLEVQLPFLQTVLSDFEILPLLTGDVDPAILATAIGPLIDGQTLLIISSDLSHYLPYQQANAVDAVANAIIPAVDLRNVQHLDACGDSAIITALYLAKKFGWRGQLLDYKNSGDTAGAKDAVVGYGAYAFTAT